MQNEKLDFLMPAETEGVGLLLLRLGITPNYAGFHQTVCAVELAVRTPRALTMVSKECYPAVAARCATTAQAVERNLRTVVRIAWASNPVLLGELAGHPLGARPKPASFIAMLAGHFLYAEGAAR